VGHPPLSHHANALIRELFDGLTVRFRSGSTPTAAPGSQDRQRKIGFQGRNIIEPCGCGLGYDVDLCRSRLSVERDQQSEEDVRFGSLRRFLRALAKSAYPPTLTVKADGQTGSLGSFGPLSSVSRPSTLHAGDWLAKLLITGAITGACCESGELGGYDALHP
jgi:hypothetical protein